MLKAYKYRIYPTKTQIALIEKYFGSTRFLYNYFLDYRQKEYVADVAWSEFMRQRRFQ